MYTHAGWQMVDRQGGSIELQLAAVLFDMSDQRRRGRRSFSFRSLRIGFRPSYVERHKSFPRLRAAYRRDSVDCFAQLTCESFSLCTW